MIKFLEDNHTYTSMEGEDFISVTKLIHLFEPKKDWDEIKRKYAKKNKLTIEEVSHKWKSENIKSLDRGTKYHKMREEELLQFDTLTVEENTLKIIKPQIDDGYRIAPPQKLEDGVYPELIVYLKSAKVCGQADLVKIYNKRVFISDWKTNKEIKMEGFINWKKQEEKLCKPLNNIGNSNFWIYALQLNTYLYIILKNNPKLSLGGMELLHVKFNEFEEVDTITQHEVPDLQRDVDRMIKHYKKYGKDI